MKVSVLRDNLAYGLSVVNRAVSARSTNPILRNVLLATEEGHLRLSATDMELAITCWVEPVAIDEDGATTVEARMFTSLVSTLPNDVVRLDYDEDAQILTVECANSHNTFNCLPADDFPPLTVGDDAPQLVMPAAQWREVVQQVAFAAAEDDARPTLMGVSVQVSDGVMEFAATDGYRLSVRRVALEAAPDVQWKVVVPARALTELARIAGKTAGDVRFSVLAERQQVVFRTDQVEVVSQLIAGQYPDYPRIIPQGYNTRVVLARDAFLEACKRVEVFASEGNHIVKLVITPGDDAPGVVEVSGTADEKGSSANRLSAVVEGEGITIAFNVRYLREALEVMPTPDVALELIAPENPCVLRPVGRDDFLHLIMPVKI